MQGIKEAAKHILKLFSFRNYVFNVNTRKYWDRQWDKDIASLPEHRRLKKLYEEIIRLVPQGSKVLDAGCGIGLFMRMAKERRQCDVFGIDISQRAIDEIKKEGMKGEIGELPPVPLPSGSFDVVVATELLEHVKRPQLLLAELFRVTKKGGRVFVSVPDNCLPPHIEREPVHSFDRRKLEKLIKKVNHRASYSLVSVKEDEGETHLGRLLAICEK